MKTLVNHMRNTCRKIVNHKIFRGEG